MKKIVALIIVVALLATALCACGGKTETKNVPAADIAAAVAEKIGKTDSLTAVEANWVRGWMKTDASLFGDYTVMVNVYGANVDEYGIFKAGEDMSAADVEKTVQAYLDLRLQSWMDEYMPEEKYKVEDASYKVLGDYVMYCILSGEDSAAAFATFEGMLK
ncbi:MAG: DUF4358 domain-containing protein [Oscillospiraceae bacterium]|nr:DUF4358 domain-containing protein [Oscillospiraceae bacterium]